MKWRRDVCVSVYDPIEEEEESRSANSSLQRIYSRKGRKGDDVVMRWRFIEHLLRLRDRDTFAPQTQAVHPFHPFIRCRAGTMTTANSTQKSNKNKKWNIDVHIKVLTLSWEEPEMAFWWGEDADGGRRRGRAGWAASRTAVWILWSSTVTTVSHSPPPSRSPLPLSRPLNDLSIPTMKAIKGRFNFFLCFNLLLISYLYRCSDHMVIISLKNNSQKYNWK